MLTQLTARAVFSPKSCSEHILEIAAKHDYETRPTAEELCVSYPTFLRVIRRLRIKESLRKLWLEKRKAKRDEAKVCSA